MKCLKCNDTIRERAFLGGERTTELFIRYCKSHSENPPDNHFNKKCGHHLLEIKEFPSITYSEPKSYTSKHRIITSIATIATQDGGLLNVKKKILPLLNK